MASIYDLQTSELEQLKQLKDKYGTATDDLAKQNLRTQANALRSKYGITTDTATAEDIGSVLNSRKSATDQISTQQMSEQRIADLAEAQKQKAIAGLTSSRDAALSALGAEQKAIAPQYQANRNEIAGQAATEAKRLAEMMAKSGLGGAGASVQLQQQNQGQLQGNLAASNTAESNAQADILRRQTEAQNAYNTGLQSSAAESQIASIQNLINQSNTNRGLAMQEAGLTGTYNGTQTQAARESALNQAAQQQAYAESVRQFNEQQAQQKAQFNEGVRQFDAQMDLNTKQWIAANQMDLRQQTFSEAQAQIQNALNQGQLSLSQSNNALSWAKYNSENNPESLDYQIKQAQLTGLQQDNANALNKTTTTNSTAFNTDLLKDPNFSSLLKSSQSTVKAEKDAMKEYLTNYEASIIQLYGRAGYNALKEFANQK